MVKYSCCFCNFYTTLLGNYERHLKTQKHLNNEDNYYKESEKGIKETQKRPIKDPQKTQLTLFETQKRPEKQPIMKAGKRPSTGTK